MMAMELELVRFWTNVMTHTIQGHGRKQGSGFHFRLLVQATAVLSGKWSLVMLCGWFVCESRVVWMAQGVIADLFGLSMFSSNGFLQWFPPMVYPCFSCFHLSGSSRALSHQPIIMLTSVQS